MIDLFYPSKRILETICDEEIPITTYILFQTGRKKEQEEKLMRSFLTGLIYQIMDNYNCITKINQIDTGKILSVPMEANKMLEFKIKNASEWKSTNLCEAVLTTIGELNRFHNMNKTSKCQIEGCSGPNLYLATKEDIKNSLRQHPEYNSEKIYQCLTEIEKDDLVTKHWTGGYLLN